MAFAEPLLHLMLTVLLTVYSSQTLWNIAVEKQIELALKIFSYLYQEIDFAKADEFKTEISIMHVISCLLFFGLLSILVYLTFVLKLDYTTVSDLQNDYYVLKWTSFTHSFCNFSKCHEKCSHFMGW